MSERQDCRFIRRKGDFMNNNQTSAVNNTANKTFTTKYMVELAAMIAIIIIMAFTPLGYIKLPGLTITFLTIPVAVGAIILGPVGGLICGLTFGLTSLYQAVTGGSVFTFALFNISPVFTIILTVVPRTLEGLLTGLIFKVLHNIRSVQKVSYYIASLAWRRKLQGNRTDFLSGDLFPGSGCCDSVYTFHRILAIYFKEYHFVPSHL